jgi:hypothetical protein
MHTYEHTTTYVPVQYTIDKTGFWVFKRNSPLPSLPVPESLLTADEYQKEMNEMGGQGWELVSVQSLLRGVHHVPHGNTATGAVVSYPLTAGFYFFWKRRMTIAK